MKERTSYNFELANGKALSVTFSVLNEVLNTYNFALHLNGFNVGSRSARDIEKDHYQI